MGVGEMVQVHVHVVWNIMSGGTAVDGCLVGVDLASSFLWLYLLVGGSRLFIYLFLFFPFLSI
ncbi:hypothetical protein V8F06_007749 [Rhypophila decipiens]